MQSEFAQIYQKLSTVNDDEEKRELLLDAVAFIADLFAAPLGLFADEVALQAVVSKGNSLRFLFPRVLYESGATFPISNTSIAGSSVLMKRPTFNNNVSSTKHLMFYEKLNTGVRPPMPIHKMATIPLIWNETVIGLVQLSRRAKTHEEAGADFSAQDVAALKDPLTLATALFSDFVYGKV